MSIVVEGIGRTKFGILPQETLSSLIEKAAKSALLDANLTIDKIDCVVVSNFLGGILQNQLHLNSIFSTIFPEYTGESLRVESACASGGVAIGTAVRMLKEHKTTLVVGVEKMTGFSAPETTKAVAAAGSVDFDQANGLIFPGAYALVAGAHMNKYGTTLEDLARVSLKNHANANLNELAHFFHKKVSLEQIRNAAIIASPLRLFDCSPVSDGAAALIITNKPPKKGEIIISASALSTDTITLARRSSFVSFPAAKRAAQTAYLQAGTNPREIDLFEVHDCFTIAELVAMEDVGICKPGEAAKLVRARETELSGKFPINSDGGLKADGHPIGATGGGQVFEIVQQLRNRAGKRQIDGVKKALAHNVGGVGGTCAVHILEVF
ncbi:MAG: thiolase domain-containing protein [archaeon]